MFSAETPPRRKRPLTYGKRSRDIHRDISLSSEPLISPTLRGSPSKVLDASPSPKTTTDALDPSKAPYVDPQSFDVPSSEDERPPIVRSNARSLSPLGANTIGILPGVGSKRNHHFLSKQLPVLGKKKRKVDDALNDNAVQGNARHPRPRSRQDTLGYKDSTLDLGKRSKSTDKPKTTGKLVRARLFSCGDQYNGFEESASKVIPAEKSRIPTIPGRIELSSETKIEISSGDALWNIPDSDPESEVKNAQRKLKGGTPRKRGKLQKSKPYGGLINRSFYGTKNGTIATDPARRPDSPAATSQMSDGATSVREVIGPYTPERRSRNTESPTRQDSDNTPPVLVTPNGVSASRHRGVTTPTQARLWETLLDDDKTAQTPSGFLGRLNLDQSEQSTSLLGSAEKALPRKRLIDTLMPSVPTSSSNIVDLDEESWSDRNDERPKVSSDGFYDDSSPRLLAQSSGSPNNIASEPLHARSQARGPKFTYSGPRTHLADSNDALENIFFQPLDVETSPITGTALRDKVEPNLEGAGSGSQIGPGLDEDENGSKAVRTIHDLRAGGDSERFTDEISEILDDLGSNTSTVSRKRAAILELCQKLEDPMFRTRFIRGGHDFRIFQLCSSESDPVIGAATAVAVLITLGSDGSSCNPSHLLDAGILAMLYRMLYWKRDLKFIAKERSSNMSRVAQGSVEKLCEQVIRNPLWKDKNLRSVSPMSLALNALDLTIRRLRETGNTETLLEPESLSRLLEIFGSNVQCSNAGDATDTGRADLDQLEIVMSILESCTAVATCALDSSLWDERLLEHLVDYLDRALSISMPRERAIQRLIPRLSLNLANNNARTSRKFAEGSFIQLLILRILGEFDRLADAAAEQSLDLDLVLLSLGAMLNLAEWSDEVRQAVIREGNELLNALIQVFRRGRKQSGEANSLAASQANVAYGWLAVLLGNLCQNTKISKHVRDALPGDGLSDVVEAVDEFIIHHKEADKAAQSNESYVLFTQRLQSVAEMLRTL